MGKPCLTHGTRPSADCSTPGGADSWTWTLTGGGNLRAGEPTTTSPNSWAASCIAHPELRRWKTPEESRPGLAGSGWSATPPSCATNWATGRFAKRLFRALEADLSFGFKWRETFWSLLGKRALWTKALSNCNPLLRANGGFNSATAPKLPGLRAAPRPRRNNPLLNSALNFFFVPPPV